MKHLFVLSSFFSSIYANPVSPGEAQSKISDAGAVIGDYIGTSAGKSIGGGLAGLLPFGDDPVVGGALATASSTIGKAIGKDVGKSIGKTIGSIIVPGDAGANSAGADAAAGEKPTVDADKTAAALPKTSGGKKKEK